MPGCDRTCFKETCTAGVTVKLPVVHLKDVTAMTQAQLDERLSLLAALLEERTRFGLMIELGASSEIDARKQLNEWIKRREPELKELCIGIAFVVRSIALRFVISAAVLVIGKPLPYAVFATPEEGAQWILSNGMTPTS